ncbi:hypothetical protein L227DRAFT_654874 [Lentinus tigrinus ALCF2SS1-6]|uniref:Glycosyltransferase family 25 protein n=1 Tax=Lentinus tigrinus ALCF2SS1-6 TaxID=1328759 RepID=A0A5C2S4K2_9APHY|nr:hypothetical protein L227DRAFT_654874 [Lentinus tigrinus ALCF2SS1-6]
MAGVLSRRRLIALLLFSVICFLYICSSPPEPRLVHQRPSYRPHSSPQDNAIVSQDVLRGEPQDSSLQLSESSTTLAVFSQLFVISRPTRLDRRATMEQLRAALGLEWTYVDGISSDDHVVERIGKCLRSSRNHNHLRTFQWPPRSEVDQVVLSLLPLSLNASDFWLSKTSDTSCRYPVPPAINASSQARDLVDVSLVDSSPSARASGDLHSRAVSSPSLPLTCAVQDRTHGVKYKPSLPSYMLLTTAKFACWYSHLDVIQRVAAFGEPLLGLDGSRGAALILEDDVDMERDIRERLRDVWSVLPDDWDIVFLGHCWSNEARYPALRPKGKSQVSGLYPKMSVHPSFAPRCTHAYALSRAGARRILLHLLYPPFAYSRALDQALAWLVQTGRLRAFSVVPSLVVQHKLTGSDIDGGENGLGSGWKDQLEHGFFHV